MFENANTYEEKALQIEEEETSVLKDLLHKQQKQLFYSRLSGIAMLVMAITLIIVCLLLVPKALVTLNSANLLIEKTTATVENLEGTLAQTDSMIAEISSAAEGINDLVDKNSELLTDSVAKLNSIDFEGLNSAIADLQAVVEPMANFFGKFR